MNSSEDAPLELNAAQQAAANTQDGPLLVVAGAGTGKTRVIVERIMRLIDGGVSPASILALTFTEKAAGEMLDRVNSARSGVTLDTTIATFNGFGSDLLQAHGHEWGLGSLRLLGETGQLVFLREHLDELNLDYFAPVSNPDGQLKLLAGYVSLLKQQLIEPEQYHEYAKGLVATDDETKLEKRKQQELAAFYGTYQQLCRQQQLIDYDDQIYLTIHLLQKRPNVLQQLQERFRYILVDEFQDTNPMQSALIDLLAGRNQNVMVVGDDDQSIYGWRGATLANILDFKQRYPKTQEVTLIENYRSTQSILDAAYRLIQHNNPNRLEALNQLDKHLLAARGDGPAPQVHHFSTFEAELAWVADDINRRLRKGQSPGSIAVLARRTAGVERVHEALELYDIPHAVAGLSNDLYQEPAVKQLLEALKAVADPQDDMSLFHALIGPLFKLEHRPLASLAATARREHTKLYEALLAHDDPSVATALEKLSSWQVLAADETVGTLAYTMITDSGWKQQLYDRAEHEPLLYTQVQALSKYFRTLKEFERISGVASLQNYIVSLPALQAAGSGFEDASLDISEILVNVLSIHRAKGLEWDTVYIIDCTEGSLPLKNFGGGLELPQVLKANPTLADEHLAEERRLMYVAVTRARNELYLSHSDQHGTAKARRKPSRFLEEMFTAPAGTEHEAEAQTSLELFAPRSSAIAVPLPDTMLQRGKLNLSVSQIDTWLRCPQDFYYKYVLQMPLPPTPQLPYGTALHAAIQRLHEGRVAGIVPTLSELEAELLDSLPRGGYISAGTRVRTHAQAVQSLKTIYERFSQDPLPLESEMSFQVDVPESPLRIRGRIDAVYQVEDGIEICDFKSGMSVLTPAKAKSRATSSNQLALYALAWQLLHDEMPVRLTLDFIETGQRGSVRKQPKSLLTLRQKLDDMITKLLAGEYPPAADHTYCAHP